MSDATIISHTIQHEGVRYRVWLHYHGTQLLISSVKVGLDNESAHSLNGNAEYLREAVVSGRYKLAYHDPSSEVPINRLHVLLTAAKLLK